MDIAEVYLWGTRIGAVAQADLTAVPRFNYDRDFLRSGIEVAPITMPLSEQVFVFPTLSNQTFYGLPGLLADSLPDKFGTKLIERYLSDQGRDLRSLTAVERLLYTGKRGMGALEYAPPKEYASSTNHTIDISALVKLASSILADRENLRLPEKENVMEQLINVGTSAGGARAKAVIAWNPQTHDIRSGQIDAGDGYEHWLIKFDGVRNNKDKGDRADGQVYTRIEYAYHLMAKQAGIHMETCRLYREGKRFHFMTRRFDRSSTGEKMHMQSLGAIAHFDFNMPGAHSYEQAEQVMRMLQLSQTEVEQLFRRMMFNILTENRDDHVKNISFLMDKQGTWFLAPAYDLTFAYDPNNRWLSRHQMSMNGKTDGYTQDDFYACGRSMNITRAKVSRIKEEIVSAITQWPRFAEAAHIPEAAAMYIYNEHLKGKDRTVF